MKEVPGLSWKMGRCLVESEHAGSDHLQDLPVHSQSIDEACKNDIIDFKKALRAMRAYFLYGVDRHSIEESALAGFDQVLRDFLRRIDEWEHKKYDIAGMFNTLGEVKNTIDEAGEKLFRARALLKVKKRTEKEDDELYRKYQLLGTKAGEIMDKIILEIEEI